MNKTEKARQFALDTANKEKPQGHACMKVNHEGKIVVVNYYTETDQWLAE